MKPIFLFCVFVFAYATNIFAQKPIDVADITVKIGSKDEQILYYGFAEGDQINFSFKEVDGKEIKEVMVSEYPDILKFKDVETKSSAATKTIFVPKKNVYAFRFYNNALLASRTVKVLIQRVPSAEAARSFDTGIAWKTACDTTYEHIGDWALKEIAQTKKVLIRADTQIVSLFDKVEQLDGNYTLGAKPEAALRFKLPVNTYSPDQKNAYKSTETVSWAYWIGVGVEAQKGYADQNKKLFGIASGAAKLAGPYGVMAGLAIDGISMLGISSVGDNVIYSVEAVANGKAAKIDSGNGTTASSKNTTNLQGDITIKLKNDNIREGINVSVKAVAIVLNKTYEDQTVVEKKWIQKGKNAVKKPIIKELRVPFCK